MHRIFTSLLFSLAVLSASAIDLNTIPIKILNNSQGQFTDDQIYVAIMARATDLSDPKLQENYSIYYDLKNNHENNASMPRLDASANTLFKEGSEWPDGYANVFTKLSEIPDRTIHLAPSFSGRIFFSFGSPMYMHAFADGGYAGANLQAPGDPSHGIRWEIIEYTYGVANIRRDANGIATNPEEDLNGNRLIWINTTRVDSYQYPMGLEVYADGGNSYLKRGELLKHEDIIARWHQYYDGTPYADCLKDHIDQDNLSPSIILQPSKVAEMKNSGIFDQFIEDVWSYFHDHDITVKMGVLGTWKGRVGDDDQFTLTSVAGTYWPLGTVAQIHGKPTTEHVVEGAGYFADGNSPDMTVQAMFCGAFNRGVVKLTEEEQDWGPQTHEYFVSDKCNQYVKFFHEKDMSHLGLTYAFAYDDTYDQSSTCHCGNPEHITVTIGGFYNNGGEGGNGDGNNGLGDMSGDNGNGNNGNNGNGNNNGGNQSGPVGTLSPLSGEGSVTGSDGKELKYKWEINVEDTEATVKLTCLNPEDFVGLVGVWFNDANGETAVYNGNGWERVFEKTYPLGTTVQLTGKWAYAGGMATLDAAPLRFYVGENTTAIKQAPKAVKAVKGLYTLDGRHLPDGAPLKKGVYIQDGRKMVVR